MALGVPKEERDYLGGWSAQGRDRCSRVAVRVASNLQRLVIKGLMDKPSFLLRGKLSLTHSSQRQEEVVPGFVDTIPVEGLVVEVAPLPGSLPDSALLRADKRLKCESVRTLALVNNPREVRIAREERCHTGITFLPRGASVSEIFTSWAIATWSLVLIIFDSSSWASSCQPHLRRSVQTLCSKKGAVRAQEADCTETSSSTSPEDA